MNEISITVLLIEDNPGDARLIREMLFEANEATFELLCSECLSAGLDMLATVNVDIVLLDLSLPDSYGFDTFARVNAKASHVAIIVLSGFGDEELAIETVRAGAQDYLVKGEVDSKLLVRAIRYAIERKQTEEALKESEERYRALVETIPHGIAELDLSGMVTFANSYQYNILGYENFELLGKSVLDLLAFELNHEDLANYLANPGTNRPELTTWQGQLLKKNGQIIDIQADWAYRRDKHGHVVGFIMVLTDITERKQAEKELRIAKEAAEAANKAKSAFLANMSHELRTPMNAIIGISKMLGKYDSENLTEKQRNGLQLVYESGNRLLALINDILDLSKIEAGKMEVNLRTIFLPGFISGLEEIVKNLIGDKPIEFIIHKNVLTPPSFVSDDKKLHQILINILGNAVKFTDRGEINLKIYVIQDQLYFEVKDTGIGINNDDIVHIFDEFRQVDSSLSKKYKGTGLGLSLCKKMVTLLNGAIEVESKINRGTVVRFHIPLIHINADVKKSDMNKIILTKNMSKCQPGEDRNPKMIIEINPDGNQPVDHDSLPKILIAEDEQVGRATIKLMLESRYRLVFAENGKEAVEKYFSENPDLVLMDIMMPEMNGYDAFDEIIKNRDTNNVPIIAFTARAMKGEKEKMLAYGFDDYIPKPIDDELLYSIVEKYLGKTIFKRV